MDGGSVADVLVGVLGERFVLVVSLVDEQAWGDPAPATAREVGVQPEGCERG